jgi:Kef-type K+ transport system membrane component KefB
MSILTLIKKKHFLLPLLNSYMPVTKPMSFTAYSSASSSTKAAPQAVRLTEMSDEVQQKLVISGVSLVPQVVVFFVLALVLYLMRRGPILRNAYFDVLLWLGLFALSFGVNFGSMFIPWPIPSLVDVDTMQEFTDLP